MVKTPVDKDDKKIGFKMRQARLEAGLTQHKLAEYFGISGQQIQKFENGHNRLSAKMLHRLAILCQKPMDWFFQDITVIDQPVSSSLFLVEMVRNIRHVDNEEEQKKLIKLIKVLVDNL